MGEYILPKILSGACVEVVSLHNHLGGIVSPEDLWRMGNKRGVAGVGRRQDFVDYLIRSPSGERSLDNYLSRVFDLVESIQAGPRVVHECITLGIHQMHSCEGVLERRFGGSDLRVFSMNRFELRFNPIKRTGAHITPEGKVCSQYDLDRILKSAHEACTDAKIGSKHPQGLEVCLVLCFAREVDPSVNAILAQRIANVRREYPSIVGVDLAGPESKQAFKNQAELEQFAAYYELAAGNTLGRTVHLGETPYTDVQTFCRVIKALKPHRVAHPISALRAFHEQHDDCGLKLLAERQIVVELCPYSNLLTGAVPNWQAWRQHLLALDDFGIRYTFATDNPCLQNSSLAWELEMLLQNQALSAEQLLRSLKVAEEARFALLARNRTGY